MITCWRIRLLGKKAARPLPTKKVSKRKKTFKVKSKGKSKSATRIAGTSPMKDLEDWRSDALDRMRGLILEAQPAMVEERKWKKPSNGMKGVPVWSHDGIICTGETYKAHVKLTFAHGASLPDPAGLFNGRDTGNVRRSIDITEGMTVDASAFRALVTAAVARNSAAKK